MCHKEARLFAGCLHTWGALGFSGIWAGRAVAAQPASRNWSIRAQGVNESHLAITAPVPSEETVEFEFKDLPGHKVLERYSSISGLAFAGNYIPGGTTNFIPPKGKRQYSVREITDIINEMLLSRSASI